MQGLPNYFWRSTYLRILRIWLGHILPGRSSNSFGEGIHLKNLRVLVWPPLVSRVFETVSETDSPASSGGVWLGHFLPAMCSIHFWG
jgi:hypothetical protein